VGVDGLELSAQSAPMSWRRGLASSGKKTRYPLSLRISSPDERPFYITIQTKTDFDRSTQLDNCIFIVVKATADDQAPGGVFTLSSGISGLDSLRSKKIELITSRVIHTILEFDYI
jgi:hypothetical protein